MAMKLLEKDVHEKQDTIISLRDQLEDIKNINLEMYTKLQVINFTSNTILVHKLAARWSIRFVCFDLEFTFARRALRSKRAS